MRLKLHFTKMEGCGNDYVYVNGFTEQVPQAQKPDLVRRLSDRHFGIGGDGVIFINPSDVADFEMEMYNMDGTRGEMCGNGIRCVGKYVYDHGMTGGRTSFTVESCGKIRILRLTCDGERALTVRVNMGTPVLRPAAVPAIPSKDAPADAPIISQPIGVGGRIWQMTCVSMGNPHAVIVLSREDLADSGGELRSMDLTRIGPLFENHPRFPNRINTEFVQIVDRRHVKMRVWERGTGETLACGTGACASAVACVLNGLTDRQVEVELLGGRLFIEWKEGMGDVYLTGPATEVFEGTINI